MPPESVTLLGHVADILISDPRIVHPTPTAHVWPTPTPEAAYVQGLLEADRMVRFIVDRGVHPARLSLNATLRTEGEENEATSPSYVTFQVVESVESVEDAPIWDPTFLTPWSGIEGQTATPPTP